MKVKVYEIKETVPQTMKCDLCEGTLTLISIEEGYSCETKDCLAHVKDLSEVNVHA